jgi:hypothetical protein
MKIKTKNPNWVMWKCGANSCNACKERHGKFYDKNTPIITPPLHPNCKCVLVSVTSQSAKKLSASSMAESSPAVTSATQTQNEPVSSVPGGVYGNGTTSGNTQAENNSAASSSAATSAPKIQNEPVSSVPGGVYGSGTTSGNTQIEPTQTTIKPVAFASTAPRIQNTPVSTIDGGIYKRDYAIVKEIEKGKILPNNFQNIVNKIGNC